jgi:hypothetical protein
MTKKRRKKSKKVQKEQKKAKKVKKRRKKMHCFLNSDIGVKNRKVYIERALGE